MTLSLFNLPNNILSNIYEYDDTYRNIFRKNILYAIWKKSFSHFKYNLLSNIFFQNRPILQGKVYTLLEYLFEDESATWFKFCWYDQTKSVEKPMISDICVVGTWTGGKKFSYSRNILWTDDDNNTDDTNNNYFDDFDYYDDDWWYGSNHETLFMEITLRYPYPNNPNRVIHHHFDCIIYSNQQYHGNLEDGYKFTDYLYKYSDNNYTIMQFFDPEYI